MLRAWTTTLFLASTLLFACGDDDDGGGGDTGDTSGSDASTGGDDGGGGDSDGSADNPDSGGDFTGIPCADDTCEAGTEVCCAGGEGGLMCVAECDTIPFACDGPEDCTTDGEVCCGSGMDGTQCAAAADCGEAVDGDVVCHVDTDCPEAQECCAPDQAMVGVCRAHCGGPPN
jgi:hypothetical protein